MKPLLVIGLLIAPSSEQVFAQFIGACMVVLVALYIRVIYEP